MKTVNKKKFKKMFAVNKKTGKITVKKGLPKGKYTLKIKIKDSGNGIYNAVSKVVPVKIIVK